MFSHLLSAGRLGRLTADQVVQRYAKHIGQSQKGGDIRNTKSILPLGHSSLGDVYCVRQSLLRHTARLAEFFDFQPFPLLSGCPFFGYVL